MVPKDPPHDAPEPPEDETAALGAGAPSEPAPAPDDGPSPDEPSSAEEASGAEDASPDADAPEAPAGRGGATPPARPLPAPREPAALAPRDPLTRYMQEVHRHPLLSREEEHALALRYYEEGDLDAAYRLVTANLRLVVKIANEYRRAAFNLLDLIQEGNVGLMQAVKKFDPHKGVKLSTYAAWWIRAYIIRFVMDNWRQVKLGTTQAQRKLFFNLRKEKRKLEALGFNPEPKLLAERLDVTEEEVREMDHRLSSREASLEAPVGGEDSDVSLGERLTFEGEGAEQVLADRELQEIFQEQLQVFARTLKNDRERYIFKNRLLAEEPMTLQSIGEHFGVTRERARQLEKRVVNRLRDHMTRVLPDFGDLVVEERD